MSKQQPRTARHKALIVALAAALTAAREKAGLSQREVGRRLERAHTYVNKLESGKRVPDVLEIIDYAEVTDADPAQIVRDVAKARA